MSSFRYSLSYGADGKDGVLVLLKIYFLISLAAGAALVIAGIAANAAVESVESVIKTEYAEIMESLDDTPEQVKEILDKIVDHAGLIGYLAIGAGVVVLVGFVLACILMGIINFLDVCIPSLHMFLISALL